MMMSASFAAATSQIITRRCPFAAAADCRQAGSRGGFSQPTEGDTAARNLICLYAEDGQGEKWGEEDQVQRELCPSPVDRGVLDRKAVLASS